MGRPTKLTISVKETVLAALELGATRRHAAAAAGVGERTLYHWLEKGAAETKGAYWQFMQDVKKAEGRCTVTTLHLIQSAAVTDWKAAAWILERSRGYTRTNALQVDVRDVSAGPQVDPQTELLAKLERMGGQMDAGRTERLGFFGIQDRTQLASIAVDRPLALSFQGASGIGA